MVAAVPLTTVSHTNQKNLTLNDLRNVAFGLAAAITLILVAGQIFDSGSASVSDSELTDLSAKRFANSNLVTSASTSATEDVAYSSSGSWMDTDGAITFTCTNCAGWMTFTNNADGSVSYTHLTLPTKRIV